MRGDTIYTLLVEDRHHEPYVRVYASFTDAKLVCDCEVRLALARFDIEKVVHERSENDHYSITTYDDGPKFTITVSKIL